MTESQSDTARLEDAGMLEQGNSATLIMSRTGCGKSSLLATLARHVKRHYNKVLLLYSYDGGGIPMEVQTLVLSGEIRLFRARTRDPFGKGLAWETMIKSCQGWWPTTINPRKGEVPPAVAMMPPVVTEYTALCPSGHVYQRVAHHALLKPGMCGQCNTLVNEMSWQISVTASRPKFFEDVGAVAFDSLTQMLAWGEDDLAGRAGRGDIGGLEGAIGGKIISGDEKLGQTTMSHVGFTQQQARSLVLMTNGIPGLVVPPVFTALTLEGTLEGSRVCGPELSGKKKTATAGAWFGNVLEPEKKFVGNDNSGRPRYQFMLHLDQWVDGDWVTHLCKNRVGPGVLPSTYEDEPLTNSPEDKKTAFVHFSLGKFFTELDAALKAKTTETLAEFGRTEIVANEMVTYEAPAAQGPIAVPQQGVGGIPGVSAPFAVQAPTTTGPAFSGFKPAGAFAAPGTPPPFSQGPTTAPAQPTFSAAVAPAAPVGGPPKPADVPLPFQPPVVPPFAAAPGITPAAPVTTAPQPPTPGGPPTVAPPAGRLPPPAAPVKAPGQ